MSERAQIICARGCGFRVHDRYYEEKKRFAPGVCARCSGPLLIVKPNTDTVMAGAKMNTDPRSPDAGRISYGKEEVPG